MSSHVKRARWALLVVAGLVVLVHLWVASWMAETMRPAAPEGIERMSASYQAELRFGEPPQVARAAPPAPPPRAVAPPKQPASPADTVPAPEPVASAASEAAPLPEPKPALEPQPEPEDLAASAATETPPEAVAETASSPPAETPLQAASEPPLLAMAPPSASAPNDGEAFVWPLATRVSYKLFGHYRGPVHGDATVEWLTLDSKYQVHIDAIIGPNLITNGMAMVDVANEAKVPMLSIAPIDPAADKRRINADARLRPVFGKDSVTMFEIAGLVGNHLS